MNNNDDLSSIANLIFWHIQDKILKVEDIFLILQMSWPVFIEVDGKVFLKFKYNAEYLKELKKAKLNDEYWINLFTVDDFFSDGDDQIEKPITLVQSLHQMWSAKLRDEFPNREFVFELFNGEEGEDCGLTFYEKIN